MTSTPRRASRRVGALALYVLVPVLFLSTKALFAKIFFGSTTLNFMPAIFVLVYFLLFPVAVAYLLRAVEAESRFHDLYPLALFYQVAAAATLWPPAGLVAILFYVAVRAVFARTQNVWAFLAVLAAAEGAVLASGFSLRDAKLYLGFAAIACGSATVLAAYRGIARHAWTSRPRIAAFAFLPWITVPCWYFYLMGANTPWLTRAVLSQPGMELILPPADDLGAVRAVVPLGGGYFLYANRDRMYLLENGTRTECKHEVILGRVDLPVCDPERPALCYFPMVDVGLASVDLGACRFTTHPFAKAHYDLLNADAARRYLALVDDGGATVTVVERLGPDDFRSVRTIDVRTLPGGGTARTVDFHGESVFLLARRTDGRLSLHEYDIPRNEIRTVFDTKEKVGRLQSWHGVTILGERTVYTDLSGTVAIHDWAGRPIATLRLLPLLRQIVYDAKRRLCYVVDDFGFVYVVDPFQGVLRNVVFCGFKTKNILLSGDAIYTASSAGILRIQIGAMLEGNRRAGN